MRSLENFFENYFNEDLGKLILRLSIGFLMLFHGYKKAIYGIDGIKYLVTNAGLPEFLAYGVYVGEIIIPIFIIIGFYTRVSSFIYASTMVFAILLAHSSHIFDISEKTGGLIIELPLLYMLCAIVLIFIGGGKLSLTKEQ